MNAAQIQRHETPFELDPNRIDRPKSRAGWLIHRDSTRLGPGSALPREARREASETEMSDAEMERKGFVWVPDRHEWRPALRRYFFVPGHWVRRTARPSVQCCH